MKAIGLIDDQRYLIRLDALLRTNLDAGLAPDACVSDEIALRFLRNSTESKTCPFNRLLGQIEPFAAALVNLEYRQCLP